MNFKRFAERGGFKLLAVARFSGPAYALVSYLLNCLTAKVEEVVTSAGELALILGATERQVKAALHELSDSGVVNVTERNGSTCLLKLNLDPTQWKNLGKPSEKKSRSALGDAKNVRTLHPQPPVPNGSQPVGLSADEALVFPARRSGKRSTEGRGVGLVSIEGGLRENGKSGSVQKNAAAQGADVPSSIEHESKRILEVFLKASGHVHELDEQREFEYARLLAEAHPTEHVLQLITHFGRDLPSLAMLAGAWMHYSETFHRHQHEQVDLESYRQRHQSAEKKIRTLANTELKRSQAQKTLLSADEQLLLRIFLRHEHPRRQLYWALKVRERYPHLHDFFAVTAELALPPNHNEAPNRKG
ncbi:MAG: hypothetical protein FJY29_11155 [Betaproteobacteria bacterium]|nr:hypothetical protein [Betaproteobacteria bacterium]